MLIIRRGKLAGILGDMMQDADCQRLVGDLLVAG